MGLFAKLFGHKGPDPVEVDGAEAQMLLASDDAPILVDVREQKELDALGQIPGAVHIPTSVFQQRWEELDASKPHLIYCAKGGRSMKVCHFLLEKGFEDVANLTGGFEKWDGDVDF